MAVRVPAILGVMAFVAGCGGSPWGEGGGGGGGGTTDPLIPETVSMNVEAADLEGWSSGDAQFTVQMTAQDATDLSGSYQRNATYDVGPYEAYTYQTTTSNRMVVALVRKEGGAAGMVAVDAGQFANYHGGGQVWRADIFALPTSGVGESFDYSGTYAGLLNIGEDTPGGPGGTLNPERAYRTTGRALITADFTEMRVSGGIDQRSIVDDPDLLELPDLALWATDISAEGTFTDQVYRVADDTWTSAGTYGGAFSDGAQAVSVVMVFNPLGTGDLFEHGVIVLENCAIAGGPACP